MSGRKVPARQDVLDVANGKEDRLRALSFFWPNVKHEEGVRTAVFGAVLAGGWYAIITVATPLLQIFGIWEGFGGIPPVTTFAAAIPVFAAGSSIALATFFLHWKSRTAAVFIGGWGVLDYLASVFFVVPLTGAGFTIARFLFAMMAFHGIRGTYAWHRLKREGVLQISQESK